MIVECVKWPGEDLHFEQNIISNMENFVHTYRGVPYIINIVNPPQYIL